MDFADEPYVRKYTRKTVTNRLLGWEGRAVSDAMLGEFDRSGVFDFRGDVARAIWAVTDIPEELVRVALARLIETETWIVNERSIVWPTLPEAQGCVKSDRLRQQASRAQRNADAVTGNTVTRGHTPSQAVTVSHGRSHAVTAGHTPSRPVTPSCTSSASLTSRASLAEQVPDARETLSEPAPVPMPEPAREPEPESEPDSQPEPEPVTEPIPEPPRLRLVPGGAGTRHASFPKGWRWSAETAAAATLAGVSSDELQEHVNYWTRHDFSRPSNDLDGELQAHIPDIRKHWETERFKAAARASPQQTSRPRRYGSAQPDAGKTGWEALDSPGVVQR